MEWSYFGGSEEQTEMKIWIYAKKKNSQVTSNLSRGIWDVAGLCMFDSLITH